MGEAAKCHVCEADLSFAWTDHHGIAQCIACGSPYRILHYEDDRRVDKPPSLILDASDIDRVCAFHRDTGGKVSAVGMGLSFPGGYDVARREDTEKWNDWIAAHPEHQRGAPQ